MIFNDGSFFRGNIINDYIICHKNDFSNLFFHRQNVKKFVIDPIKNYYNYFRWDVKEKIELFKGVIRNGNKEGFCHVKYSDHSVFQGFFKHNKKEGFGWLLIPSKYMFHGNFHENKVEGNGVMILDN